jgi:hypothetical protein
MHLRIDLEDRGDRMRDPGPLVDPRGGEDADG